MGSFFGGLVLSLLLLAAASMNWSLICFLDLVASLLIQFTAPKRRFRLRSRCLLLWFIYLFSLLVVLSQVIFLIVLLVVGDEWGAADNCWLNIIGFMRLQSGRSLMVIYFLLIQLAITLTAFIEMHGNGYVLAPWLDSCWGHLSTVFENIGSHIRGACCFLLPAVQLVVGISNPSWISLPFFICSCTGLIDWSLKSNFLGFFRWWRSLWWYAAFNICILHAYQLPIGFPKMFVVFVEFLGLYKISANSKWEEICSVFSLVVFYFMLSCIQYDLEEMDFVMSTREGNLNEQLLSPMNSVLVRESRSGARHSNVLSRGAAFQTLSINFFTYGFPVSLFALSFWSFHFASVCAFGLLAYVGYVVYAFPSLFHLHRLNGLLLVFILLWAVSTYIFNVAFVLLNWKLSKDMQIWEMVGLWHYPIPGFFILAQFCLGFLVALGNLVNNSVFHYLSDKDRLSPNSSYGQEVAAKEEAKVLIVATVAWGLRKCSRAIMLVLILLIATKPGFVHAIYMIFFFIYLLGHSVSTRARQTLILLCELHFATLYILQLDLVSKTLKQKGLSMEILSQLGLLDSDSIWDCAEIAILGCFCAIHNHGFEMLFSFAAIVQHAPNPPIGFSILKEGLNKSVLMSVYAARTRDRHDNHSHERKIASYLTAVGQKFLFMYRSFGTYIAFVTILLTVYLVRPNYISFGYLFLLLIWITGRQLVEKTKQRLWYPLKVYAIAVFIFIYTLSIFPSIKAWLSTKFDLSSYFGYNPRASFLANAWDSLAIMIVMQLYSYERRQSKYVRSEESESSQVGVLGFIRRFLIWHCQKISFISLFYASLSPISAFGFVYLLGLVICLPLPKASRVPSKIFLVYTGFLVMAEYLFQMYGKLAEMFPGQKHYNLSLILGFQIYKHGFWGLEVGLRGKVLVIAACILQYNVFHWIEKMPVSLLNVHRSEEPCSLFVSKEDVLPVSFSSDVENRPSLDSNELSAKRSGETSKSWPSFKPNLCQSSDLAPEGGSEGSSINKYSIGYIWGSMKESHKWNKRRIQALRKERFEMQKTTLKIYLKFWIENMFNIFGLEINMVALLLASFALLNSVSILYIVLLAACVLLDRHVIRKLWPIFVCVFASILLVEYLAMWKYLMPWSKHTLVENVRCHDCWKSSDTLFNFCKKCWLGLLVDDPRMLISYFVVFMLSCFKLRADRSSGFSGSFTYRKMVSQRKNTFVWRNLSFETKSMWTLFDYLRIYCYCHLLDVVLALILITGTFEYDILHLGYLGFALIFFRMRFTILKKKNKIFKCLRIYNFAVIVLSLAYQSPFLGDSNTGKCQTVDYIYEMIGFYKYDYGFRITSRSALVEIIIFILVSLQSYMFSSHEFDYVFRYLEAEQIGAIVREQEKRAAWKTAQLHYIRESEENKRQRNLQVEKMKSEMLNPKIRLHSMNSGVGCNDTSPHSEGLRKRRSASSSWNNDAEILDREEGTFGKQNLEFPFELPDSPTSARSESPSAMESRKHSTDFPLNEIVELQEDCTDNLSTSIDEDKKNRKQGNENPLISAVQLIGDGVSQVQSIGNQAVTNLVNFLNIPHEDSDANEPFFADNKNFDGRESLNRTYVHLDRSSSLQSDKSRISDTSSLQIQRIVSHIWSQMQSNNDLVCYCCFLLVFLWNFSLLSMVYLAALFLYAICVNTGPSYIFWVVMLIYTEIYILLDYLYQIISQHCGLSIQLPLLRELGFHTKKITSSFVISSLPLFLVYLFTLIQSSITAKDGEWNFSVGFSNLARRVSDQNNVHATLCWSEKIKMLLKPIRSMVKMVIRNFCRYWKSLTQEAESPPYFVQLSMDVCIWPEDGIQPERIESGINQLLRIMHDERCKEENPYNCPCASRVQIQSIEKSTERPNVALAVFEVVYASPWTECVPTERYESLTPAADVSKEILKAQEAGILKEVGFPYSILSVIGGGRREIDLYAYIFCADLSVFFLVAIFYQSVIKNKSEILEVYQLEDQFPIEFVLILMIIFFLIVLDRIIYLCSFTTGKVIFYLFNLILFTYSITVYAWHIESSRQSAAGLALRAIYLTKAISLALQAVQIRYGIPHKSTLYRQFLTSEVSRVNYLGYRLYRALPFLYELRCVLDWSCTTTSLTMYDWLKLEDINASLYLVKCDNILNRATHKQGERQTKMTKCCNGICLFFILICVIWAPMLMYSSGNPTNIANPINDASVQLDIKTGGGRLTLFQTTLCEIHPWDQINCSLDIDAYNEKDVQLICCQADGSTMWLVPDMIQRRFSQSLNHNMSIKFSWVLTRDRPKGKEVVKYERSVDPSSLPQPSDVEKVFNGSTNSFRVFNIYPRNFRVTGSGDVRPVEQKVIDVSADLVLHQGESKWWSFHDINSKNFSICGSEIGPMAVVISEETPQGLLGETLSKFSIWGLYITFVLAVGRFIRLQCSDLRMRIPYENLPSCDRLIAICEDIYAARAEGELGVEEILYWTLVKIYRSPHMLLEYTKVD